MAFARASNRSHGLATAGLVSIPARNCTRAPLSLVQRAPRGRHHEHRRLSRLYKRTAPREHNSPNICCLEASRGPIAPAPARWTMPKTKMTWSQAWPRHLAVCCCSSKRQGARGRAYFKRALLTCYAVRSNGVVQKKSHFFFSDIFEYRDRIVKFIRSWMSI